jgi:hypothetical protein
MRRSPTLLALLVAACGGGGGGAPDARGDDVPDAATVDDAAAPDASVPDAHAPDAAAPDAEPDAVPLAGFGTITGQCGILAEPELTGASPLYFQGDLDFMADRYDDPADRDQLTAGGLEVLTDGNAGGSSVYSEVFAFEVLHRCELADLLKTENEIVYDDPMSKKADLLVSIDGHKVGVSVTRAVTFPFGDPYTLERATLLLDRKLDDILLARAAANEADRWEKSMVAVLAYDAQHASTMMEAWNGLDAATRADSLVIVFVTSGDDLFVYTDQ